jgi:tRNA pseudouridine55 synthase
LAQVDGVLVVDKPAQLTSHDVVAAARRALGERRIGHTGTLDPLATGVLVLACGRATRLVRFLTAADKEYEATIRLGVVTDTGDVTGTEVARSDRRPARDEIERALAALTGTYLQQPPAFSAKKVDGQRAYVMARKAQPVALAPVQVTVPHVDLLAVGPDTVDVRLTCSAGFYVRSFAQSLGELAGSGGCLAALRRTRSGEFTLAQAVSLDALVAAPGSAIERVVPIDHLLQTLPARRLTEDECRRVAHGQDVAMGGPAAALRPAGGPAGAGAPGPWIRLMTGDGRLLGLATPGSRPGSLHPAVVLT